MRKSFEVQYELGRIAIEDAPIRMKSRDSATKIGLALRTVYREKDCHSAILDILEREILSNKKRTGHAGLNLWQIFVLSQYRLGLDLSYDRLHYMSNNDYTMRCLLGVESSLGGMERDEFEYQQILGNVGLLTDDIVNQINAVLVDWGQGKVF